MPGKASKVDSVKVRFLDGTVRILENVQANQNLIIFEDTGTAAVEPSRKLLTSLGQIKRSVLYQNYPNPFNPETWIPYRLSEPSEVTIYIYSMTGELVRVLNCGQQDAGYYLSKTRAAYWDGRNLNGESAASSVYFYRIKAGNFSETKNMILIR